MFWGWRIQDLGNDLRPPIMCFDFGALKTYRKDSQQSLLNQSTGTSEPWELRGAVSGSQVSTFSEALILGGGLVLKRVQHYVLVKYLDLQKIQASGKWCVICFCIASYCLPSLLSQVPWQIAMSLSRTGQSTSWRQVAGTGFAHLCIGGLV